ncbi:alpha/beta hydrolase domain-containing protein [Gordonia soli]|uniref:Alpha/beta hydrolase domain-containing protein n=1 Tax=Gordonia soli NBRC 108243 TaxID=1223545 RepID=M0QHB4_9ACTN|nr:alpha/beta hydrolase domain-containing protein [Gordonia soli]GAC67819.1 hypothetical protein GS4_11_00880 [Gordonia soli NBRC 108243]
MTDVGFRPLAGGAGVSLMSATPGPDLGAHGYAEAEFSASGVAERFSAGDGHDVEPIDSATYTTRIVVRRPTDPARFSGTVVVEWFNVSSGADAAPEYTYLADEIVRAGHAWVGVSAQYDGVVGSSGSVGLDSGVPGGLLGADAERYGHLTHPGDAYCYDIFGGVGAALRSIDGPDHPLSGLDVTTLIAVGESQSAFALTTYVNLFLPRHRVHDGVLIHSRAAGSLGLGDVGTGADTDATFDQPPTLLREDLAARVIVVQTETDVLTNFRFHLARQPDTERLRIWEVAGTAHADLVQIGPYEEMLGCPHPVNRGQQQFVLRAALHHLVDWVHDTGTRPAPPHAEPLRLRPATDPEVFDVDDVGNVLGGVRTPRVDVATELLSGIVDADLPRICVLFGSTTPLPADVLRARFDGRADYLDRYRAATDAMIEAGFALAVDRDALLADANPEPIDG